MIRIMHEVWSVLNKDIKDIIYGYLDSFFIRIESNLHFYNNNKI